MIKLDRETVQHWCPVAGNQIICDTSRSKSCLHCKFAVHRLVVAKPRFVQYVFLAHVISILFFIYYILVQDDFLLLIAIPIFLFDFAFFCLAKYKILSRMSFRVIPVNPSRSISPRALSLQGHVHYISNSWRSYHVWNWRRTIKSLPRILDGIRSTRMVLR